MTEIDKINERAIRYRGTIIEMTAPLEKYMDYFLAKYFCETTEKQFEFIEIMFGGNRISLDGKRKIIDTIIKKSYPHLLTTYPNYNKDIGMVLYQRNKFAHRIADISEDAKQRCDNEIRLIRYDLDTNSEWYDDAKIYEITECIIRCINVIRGLVFKS